MLDEQKIETLNTLAMSDDHFYAFGDPQDHPFNRTANAHLIFLLLPSSPFIECGDSLATMAAANLLDNVL